MSSAPPSARPSGLTGSLLALLSTTGFALSPILILMARDQGVSPETVTALRFLLALATLPLIFRAARIVLRDWRRLGPAFLLMGLCYAVESFGYAKAVTLIPIGLAVLIVYLFPLLVALIAAVADRTPPTPLRWLSLLLAFAGVGIAIGPGIDRLNPLGLCLAGLAAVTAAFTIWRGAALTRELGALPVSGLSLIMAGVLYIPALLLVDSPQPPASGAGWALALGAGAAFLFGLVLFFAAAARIGAVRASLFANIEPAVTALYAFWLIAEAPGEGQLAGMALVIFALCLPERWPRPASPDQRTHM